MKTLEYIADRISKANSVLIFCHMRPDGDTLGSAFALKFALESLGKKSDVVCESEYPQKFEFLGYGKQLFTPENVTYSYDLHLSVDVAGENLLGNAWGLYRKCKKPICIDHHPSNERFVEDYYVEPLAATSMIIYRLIGLIGVEVTESIATAVLLGIVTDTGCFANANTDKECLRIASEMMAKGADYQKLMYETRKLSLARSRLLVEMLSHERRYFNNRLSLIYTTQDMLDKYGLTADTANEGFVDMPLWVDGVLVAVSLLGDKRGVYRVSFRSRGSVNVNNVAAEFGGGGHPNASGCIIRGLFEEVVEKIVRAVEINTDW